MPLEIKELQIRVTVNQPQGPSKPQQVSSAASGGDKTDKDAIINQCVEQVFDMIKNKKER